MVMSITVWRHAFEDGRVRGVSYRVDPDRSLTAHPAHEPTPRARTPDCSGAPMRFVLGSAIALLISCSRPEWNDAGSALHIGIAVLLAERAGS